jgi:NCAIR mutase (PurE)-related protein
MEKILNDFKNGKISIEEVMQKIKILPYENLGFAKIDTHRMIRKGFPETIYCQGKTIPQIIKIIENMEKNKHNIFATKANDKIFSEIKKIFSEARYNKQAKTITIEKYPVKKKKGNILIVTGGTSDIPVAEEAYEIASLMGNNIDKSYDVGVAGIHRLFDIKEKLFTANVIIVIAGMEGALASIIGGISSKPIIAVPTSIGYGASFKGIAPLLTMLNSCAEGIVVVNIDNGFGAGYFASLINR